MQVDEVLHVLGGISDASVTRAASERAATIKLSLFVNVSRLKSPMKKILFSTLNGRYSDKISLIAVWPWHFLGI